MLISRAAVGFLTVAINCAAASYHYDRFGTSQPLWGVVSYGGDSSEPTPDNDGADGEKAKNNSILKPTSCQVLNSVSAGGGSPADASATAAAAAALTPAFVGPAKNQAATSAHRQAVTTTLKGAPPSGASLTEPADSSASALSVATNQQQHSANALDGAAGTGEEKSTATDAMKKRPLKILFLSSDTGGGHRASAEALANQFQRHFPGTTYDLMDIWTDIDSSWPYNTIKDTYKSFSATPWKWRTLYHVSNTAIYAKFADLHSYYMCEDMIREKIETFDPDVVGKTIGLTFRRCSLFWPTRVFIRKFSFRVSVGAPNYELVRYAHLATSLLFALCTQSELFSLFQCPTLLCTKDIRENRQRHSFLYCCYRVRPWFLCPFLPCVEGEVSYVAVFFIRLTCLLLVASAVVTALVRCYESLRCKHLPPLLLARPRC